MTDVKQENYGFRDERISQRHRKWGVGCPAVDIDFALLEFNYNKPVAIVEYKHSNININKINLNHPTYLAIKALADGYGEGPLPFLIAVYNPSNWFFKIIPVNQTAKEYYRDNTELSEQRFVKSLYYMRKSSLSKSDIEAISALNAGQEAA